MKPIIISFTLILMILIGCSVIPYRKPVSIIPKIGQDKPLLPVLDLEINPEPLVVMDTSNETDPPAPEPVIVVQQLDTAMLRVWFENIHNDPKFRISIMDDIRVQAVLSQFEITLAENEGLMMQLIESEKEKIKAEKTVQVAKSAIYEIPTMFFVMGLMFSFFAAIIIYKQHYSRVKLEKQIERIKSCRKD